ncbi:HNH endonuclease [Erwinia tracheiphila]|uniref:HNH endonuclease n=1 Tax=Erwinia tracheiphila TaxID=65700 RepID=A0A345CT60_9GAMM|nr:HNH endonuclease signature motif containing protein [Erwinia tracheiphila]AXF76627.1 HNH endonuclease [Erwinia tracheiphila]UIA84702.1 HNH endonuclease [Erwinia tracheiphila]UIA93294.1 HNH endonuclease [Erwinia tracheiphila]
MSNLGRVRSKRPKGNYLILKSNRLRHGYVSFRLYKNKSPKAFTAHQLVAKAFVTNPEGKPQVNHINGVKDDNRAENLEWSTRSENQKHAFRTRLNVSASGTLSRNFKGKVVATNIESGKIIILAGTADIQRYGFSPSEVYKVINNASRNAHRGYTFTRAVN